MLNVTDLHMEIRAYNYFTDQPKEGGGLACAAALIDQFRGEAQNCLTFDNGDFLQGTPMGEYIAQCWANGEKLEHPMIDAMNLVGFDAATVGNHEFNYGVDFLQSALGQAAFPVVSANVATKLGSAPVRDETLFAPYVMLERTVKDLSGRQHRLKIGVIGFVPPQILHWDGKHLHGRVFLRDIVEAARDYVPRMRAEGADLVIALSHSGIEQTKETTNLENASLPLAAISGIDVVITGHSHLVFPSDSFNDVTNVDAQTGFIHNKPATMAGFGGSHVGLIDLTLSKVAESWTLKKAKVQVPQVPKKGLPLSPTKLAILAKTNATHERTLDYIRRPIGQTEKSLDSFLSMLHPSASVLTVAAAQAWYLERALRGTDLADLPLLSAAAPFMMGGRGGPKNFTDVPAGPIAIRDVAALYSFPNFLCAVRLNGEDLLNWLEYSAGFFLQIQPHKQDQPLRHPDFPPHNFDTIYGLRYEFDLSQPARFSPTGRLLNPKHGRVRNLMYNNRPVTADMQFIAATNDYRASKSGAYPGIDDGEVVLSEPVAVREVLIDYLKASPPDRVLGPAPWRLRPITEASVLFETGTGALKNPEALSALEIEVLGENAAGFLECRKRL